MKLHLENCNNIDNGDVEVNENMLNIKYAINGTGKSTICSAITLAVRDKSQKQNAISSLKPYKCLDDEAVHPSITGIDGINNVRIFNEEYIDEYIFQQDELVKGSFDIFIRNEEYDRGILEIESLVQEIKTILLTDKEIESLKNDFGELINAFGKETKKGLHGSSMMSKAFKEGNKVENIPPGLEMYEDYIHSKENYRWIKWQLDGQAFIDITENCPYCITDIKEKKDTIRKVSQSYDPKIIENMTKILLVFQRLGEYFSEKTKETINTFVKSVSGYTEEQAEFLREVRDQIERLKRKFENAQTIGFNSLKDVDKVIDGLKEYIIDLTLYNHLDSAKTAEKVSIVNSSIEKVTEKAGILQGCIKKQQRLIETIVKTNKEEINAFLSNAGYKYHVDLIEDDSGIRRLKLLYTDTNGIVLDVKGHLSFGEKNAISLVLFMYDAIKSKPDMIILDDPISSFDKNKKYAIIDMLFRKEKFLKGKTVLMLTHDFDPIVDMMLVHTDRFETPYATFLENNNGLLSEKAILKENIKTFIDICNDNIYASTSTLNKLVYLRRLYEITKQNTMGYQLLSNIFHKREVPEIHSVSGITIMEPADIVKGEEELRERIDSFKYTEIISLVRNDSDMIASYVAAPNNYEKLHFYRMIFDDKTSLIESDVVKKFINEAFHIENNYIYQLNPCEYQIIPNYIIDECDQHIELLKKDS